LSKLKTQRGMTLVELMVAIVVIAVGILALASLFPLGRARVTRSGNDAKAYAYAQDGLEMAKNWSYDNLSSRPLPVPGPDSLQYTRTLAVTRDAPEAGLSTAAVSVSYQDAKGPRTVTIFTYFTKQIGR
jgi:prepilin-type N-terminal cleavage/methylation domain-containing protein